MLGPSNTPQTFARYDHDLPFFVQFGFGSRISGINWFAADGIPIMPVDDAGRTNSYPLMQVSADNLLQGDLVRQLFRRCEPVLASNTQRNFVTGQFVPHHNAQIRHAGDNCAIN
jgi:hypothetical protein